MNIKFKWISQAQNNNTNLHTSYICLNNFFYKVSVQIWQLRTPTPEHSLLSEDAAIALMDTTLSIKYLDYPNFSTIETGNPNMSSFNCKYYKKFNYDFTWDQGL